MELTDADFEAVVEGARAAIKKAETTVRALPPLSAPSEAEIDRVFNAYATR
jgi:hypothetical protein